MITLYTQPGCMPCRATKRQLDAAIFLATHGGAA